MTNQRPLTTVVDRNGTPLKVGDYVTIAAIEGTRSGVVVFVPTSDALANCNGHWVDVHGLLGIEGIPSTMLEVVADSRDTGAGGGA
jgi:hypothetical protein